METFLTDIAQRFKQTPQRILWDCLHLKYSLDEMVYILYRYTINNVDPFLNEQVFAYNVKGMGLRYIINRLFAVYGYINSETNKELSDIVTEECYMDSGIIPK